MDKIICIGKNYLDHAKELGDAVPSSPVLFLKPPSVLIKTTDNSLIGQELVAEIPKNRGSVHYECEIVLKLDQLGRPQAATLGLDLTLRELQSELKKKGLPWEVGKVFAGSAIVGPWVSLNDFNGYLDEVFEFYLDGQLRQTGRGSEMRFTPEVCLSFVRECFPICNGDLLFTGTPAGVGPIEPGQRGVLKWGRKFEYGVSFR